jgi:hypothetical protein
MTAQDVLSQVGVASPCPARWSEMKGDDRARFCDQCHLTVYNLSAMSASEAVELVTEREGRVCVRFLRRRDGMMVTSDCPVGTKIAHRRRFERFASAAALAVTSLCGGTYLLAQSADDSRHGQRGSVQDLVDWVKFQLGLATRPVGGPRVIVGEIVGGLSMPLPSTAPACPVTPPDETSTVKASADPEP